jgi:hypothetical protein
MIDAAREGDVWNAPMSISGIGNAMLPARAREERAKATTCGEAALGEKARWMIQGNFAHVRAWGRVAGCSSAAIERCEQFSGAHCCHQGIRGRSAGYLRPRGAIAGALCRALIASGGKDRDVFGIGCLEDCVLLREHLRVAARFIAAKALRDDVANIVIYGPFGRVDEVYVGVGLCQHQFNVGARSNGVRPLYIQRNLTGKAGLSRVIGVKGRQAKGSILVEIGRRQPKRLVEGRQVHLNGWVLEGVNDCNRVTSPGDACIQ